ncbi:putative periplasmic lipoprotein [Mucilaginibacter boryungensis]|uniref:Lipoprotein n=1 Tax=Mucilaginibacter boryungensis TaxID=768480 RepID=A0ABR9XED7_9SPHI|nr:hypothetical protein [Mucilaginibacter boryungensis]MBE9665413.1 hypothetical protein [Mucilaginibacter boryungensis]
MKTFIKLLAIAMLLAGCGSKNINGTYVSHTEGQFSIADDTLVIADTVIINHTGFQKIRQGQLLPKAYKTHKWTLNSPDAPPMQITGKQIQIGNTIYHKLP